MTLNRINRHWGNAVKADAHLSLTAVKQLNTEWKVQYWQDSGNAATATENTSSLKVK